MVQKFFLLLGLHGSTSVLEMRKEHEHSGNDEATPQESADKTSETNLYRCDSMTCRAQERLQAVCSSEWLSTTRRGREGEWANFFGTVCLAMGFRVRWVWSTETHIWIEYYSEQMKRWVHVDACEEALDKPQVYYKGEF